MKPAAKELQLKVLSHGRVLATQQLDNDAEYADQVARKLLRAWPQSDGVLIVPYDVQQPQRLGKEARKAMKQMYKEDQGKKVFEELESTFGL